MVFGMSALLLYARSVDSVLGFCGGSQVCVSIVEAFTVDMVNDERMGRF